MKKARSSMVRMYFTGIAFSCTYMWCVWLECWSVEPKSPNSWVVSYQGVIVLGCTHWYLLNMRGRLKVVFLGSLTSFNYWPYETTLPNQISVFQKCKPVVYARLGLWNDDCGTLTKLHWLVWARSLTPCYENIKLGVMSSTLTMFSGLGLLTMKHWWLWLVIV